MHIPWLPNRSIKFERLNASPPHVQQEQIIDPTSLWVKGNNLDIELRIENKEDTAARKIKQEIDDTDVSIDCAYIFQLFLAFVVYIEYE